MEASRPAMNADSPIGCAQNAASADAPGPARAGDEGAGPGGRVADRQDLVAGSGLAFEDAGEHDLQGVPNRWHLYRVTEP